MYIGICDMYLSYMIIYIFIYIYIYTDSIIFTSITILILLLSSSLSLIAIIASSHRQGPRHVLRPVGVNIGSSNMAGWKMDHRFIGEFLIKPFIQFGDFPASHVYQGYMPTAVVPGQNGGIHQSVHPSESQYNV